MNQKPRRVSFRPPAFVNPKRCVRDAISPQTFYAPDLTPFVRQLRGDGVPLFAAAYNHSLKICSTRCEKVLVYSASVVMPGTGHLVEVGIALVMTCRITSARLHH